eukprot:snap_masked-scaffold_8-processed-gene-2.24-mRNA-1 protein AED:1.00 eAED:1.00 QI:0/-1/0/0/-1/1/1/0/247
MKQKKLVVKQSTVKEGGKGLFADELIEKETIFIEYTGKILNFGQAKELADRSYLKGISLSKHIDGNVPEASIAKYINDNMNLKKINCRFLKRFGRVFVQTLRNVEKGEELFLSYGRSFWLFQSNLKFLNLSVAAGKLHTTMTLKPLDLVSVIFSDLQKPVLHPIGGKAVLVDDETAANCVVKINPFVRNTFMISVIKNIKAEEPILISKKSLEEGKFAESLQSLLTKNNIVLSAIEPGFFAFKASET